MFWYCHKRGRETRLAREAIVDSEGRVIELEDDAMLNEGGPSVNSARTNGNTNASSNGERPDSRRQCQPGRDNPRRSSERATAGARGKNETNEKRR